MNAPIDPDRAAQPIADGGRPVTSPAACIDEVGGMLAAAFLEAIVAERGRAHAKHGATSMEQAPPLDPWRGLILGEEALECGKALNDDRHGAIELARIVQLLPIVTVGDELDKELIQTAAMAFTWWANRRGHRLAAGESS